MAIDDGAAARGVTKIDDGEVVGFSRAVLGIFQIRPANPKAFLLEPRDEMIADKAAGATYKSTLHNHLSHFS